MSPSAVAFGLPHDLVARLVVTAQQYLHVFGTCGDCPGAGGLVFRDSSLDCSWTSGLMLLFFRHGMSYSVPVHPPGPYPDVLHHGCRAEHGQVQLLR